MIIKFNFINKWDICCNRLVNKTRNIVYNLISHKYFCPNIPVKVGIKLLETLVIPVLLYGAEIWYPNKTYLNKLERVYKLAIKNILGVKRTTCDGFVYGELGLLSIKYRIIEKHIRLIDRLNRHKPNHLTKMVHLFRISQDFNNNKWFI